MKVYRVEFSRRADQQLERLYHFLLRKAGERIALRYIERLIAFCNGLSRFPHRGDLRPDLGEDVRVIGFHDTASVQFRVREDKVQVLNISYGGENYSRYFDSHRSQ